MKNTTLSLIKDKESAFGFWSSAVIVKLFLKKKIKKGIKKEWKLTISI